MAQKEIVKVDKDGNKKFKGYFHYVGKVKPHQKKDEITGSWEEIPYFEEKPTRKSGKPRRSVVFQLETAESNNLKLEVAGMEQDYAYPYSSTDKKSFKITWADRLDKTKYPNDTYHIINGTDWDRAKEIGDQLKKDIWVEVRGSFEFSTFEDNSGEGDKTSIKRMVEQFRVIEDGAEINLGKNNKITYVTDFKSPDFIEVNKYTLQIGIKSAYQESAGMNTRVNAVFLTGGEPYDVELTAYYTEPKEGAIALADACASLKRLDFIEVTGTDNNRATFAYVPIEETLPSDDPFAAVDDSQKVIREERVNNGSKKGLEITGYTTGTILRGFLKESEITKVFNQSPDPFDTTAADPFSQVNISPDDLPF